MSVVSDASSLHISWTSGFIYVIVDLTRDEAAAIFKTRYTAMIEVIEGKARPTSKYLKKCTRNGGSMKYRIENPPRDRESGREREREEYYSCQSYMHIHNPTFPQKKESLPRKKPSD